MQRIGQNGGLCHGEQKANFYNSRKIASKRSVVVVVADFNNEPKMLKSVEDRKYCLVAIKY